MTTSEQYESEQHAWDGVGWLEPLSDGWHRPWRLDPRGRDISLSPDLWDRAEVNSGVRGRWRVEGSGTWQLPIRVRSGDALVDVVVDDGDVQRHTWSEGEHLLEVPVAGPTPIEVWLPNGARTDVGTPRLVGDGEILAAPVDGARWIAYGSSITQAGGAAGPTLTWPALVARQHGWRLHSYGFGGQCHLDPIVATQIAAQPADLISLCLGINIYGAGTFSARSLGPQIEGFVERVRLGHPDTPIALITPIHSPSRETTRNVAGMTLQEVREIVATVGSSLIARGDQNLTVIDGAAMITSEEMETNLSDDGLHPNTAGYARMADHLAPILGTLPATIG